MGMGAPEPSKLVNMHGESTSAAALGNPTTSRSPITNIAPSRSHATALTHSCSPPADLAPSRLSAANVTPSHSSAANIASPRSHAADITPPGSPAIPSAKNVTASSKGKQREEKDDSDDAMSAAGVAAQPGVHRYAQFTLEKRKKVTAMIQEFFGALQAYAQEENIDLTAVTKCFNERLTSMKLSSWGAIQRLLCIERHGGSKYLNHTALFLHIDTCDVFQRSILKACLMLLLEPGLQPCKMKRQTYKMKRQTSKMKRQRVMMMKTWTRMKVTMTRGVLCPWLRLYM